jgi:multiple sugar transport system permease protein
MIKRNVFNIFSFFNKPERAAYLFILPALLILTVFVFVPMISSVIFSFLKMDIFLQNIGFAGFSNFLKMFSDERVGNALINTFYFAAVEVPMQIILALLAAIYVSKNTLFRKFLRSVFFIPAVCSMTAIGILWSFLLDPQTGMYPYYLSVLGLPKLLFLKDPTLAMPSVILLTVWKNFGYSMVILIAGIQSIPASYYEAAEIDGASKRRQFFGITLPMLIPSIGFCVVTCTIGALQVFDQIYVTTNGGPLFKTETLVAYVYNVGFRSAPYDLGYASALSVMLFVLIVIISLFLNNYFMRKETSDL